MPASQACKYAVQSSATTLGFTARSTLHPVHGTASALSGTVVAAVENGVLQLDPQPTMQVEFPVEKLTSGNNLQDQQTWKLLDSKRSPTIVARLKELALVGGNTYDASGEITLSGRTRPYKDKMTINVDGDNLIVDGTLTIDIRDFGIQPPRLLMITVQPDVTVTLHLVAAAATGAP